MKTIIRVTAKVALPLLMLFAAAICAHAQQLNMGDVVVATQGGYQVWNPGGSTSTPKATMNPAAIAGNDTTGCAFDSTFRMRAGIVPEPDPNEVVKFGIPFPSTITQTLGSGNGISGPPLSIVFDGDNNFFVGIPGATAGNTGKVVEYDATGAKINEFDNLPVDAANFMSLDINKNGKILSYSSGGPNIQVFDTTLPISNTNPTRISVINQATITSFSITGNVVTFQAGNSFAAGTTVNVTGLTTGNYLNNQPLTVLSTGLTTAQFEANFPHEAVATTNDTGTASATNTTLYGLRVLTPFDGTGGYVAAIGLDIANISSAGVVNFLYVNGADDASPIWQALAFARDGANFWATNLDNGHLIEFKLAGGETTGTTFKTGANGDGGFSGVCVVGAFSAAQPAPIPLSATLSPAPNNSNTFTFTTPGTTQVSLGNGIKGTSSSTNELFETMVFATGQNGPVTVNAWYTEIGALVGVSDNGQPCFVVDTPTPNTVGANPEPRCAIVKVESSADGTGVFTAVNMTLFTSQPGTNGRYYSDETNDETTFSLSDNGPGGCRCSTVYSIQQQKLSAGAVSGDFPCGYQIPVTGSPSDFNANAAIPLQFSVAATQHDCAIGNILDSPTLMPIIKMVKLDPGTLTGTLETGVTAGKSSGPFPAFRYDQSRKTWIANVKGNSLPTGCYIATTQDNSNQIVDFSYSAVTDPKTVFIAIGPVSSCNGITLP